MSSRSMSLLTACIFTGLLTLLSAANVQAHSLYVQGTRYHVDKGKASPFFFCYGHHIPVDDAVRRKKLNFVKVYRPDGSDYEVALRDEKSLHSYLVDYEIEGTYAIGAETTPGYFTKWLDKKGKVRHSIKPMSAIAKRASKVETSTLSRQWTKTYVECVKSTMPFPSFIGLPLEIVPEKNVSQLKKGEIATFQIYYQGKPYTGEGYWDATYTGYSTEAEDFAIQRTHITDGMIKMTVPNTGRWFLRFFFKIDAPKEAQNEYLTQKLTTTLVFEIPNERRKPKVSSH